MGESDLRLRVTLDSLSEGVILYAPDGRAAMFNTTARRILGFDPGARTVDEIICRRRVVDGDGGDIQWLMTSLRPVATDGDEPPHTVVSTFRDVTESLARERSLAAGASADDLVVNADLAMYDAKETGRDRWALYTVGDGGEQPRMKARLSALARVRWAIEHRAFELLAQPIVDLRGTPSDPMYEVLLRLRSDTGELIAPSAFLSVAERVDLIQEIDRLVVEETVAAVAGAEFPVTLSVNVSGKSIAEPALLAAIDRHQSNARKRTAS